MGAKKGDELLKSAIAGDRPSFAQFLTWLERNSPATALELPELLNSKRLTFRLGITGPPGAGKSTLVGQLIAQMRAKNWSVGVMAVDPSSPFSKGAVLGDRIRYSEHFLDPKVFIRSLGTRGSLGGLSSSAYLMARAFDLCDFDILLIETVGVGQTELDILHVADHVSVVLVPESGDSIQAMKAGLMEIADSFIINKADRPGADGLVREIEASLHDGLTQNKAKVFKTIATQNQGVQEYGQNLFEVIRTSDWKERRFAPKRLQEEARALLRSQWENSLEAHLKSVQTAPDLKALLIQNEAPPKV